MKPSEVEAFIDKHLESFITALGVAHWRVNITYNADNRPEWIASCSRTEDYWIAAINIDCEKHKDEKELVDTLIHELTHVLIAPFDLFIESALQHVDGDAYKVLDRLRDYAIEASVRNIMRMLKGWTYNNESIQIEKNELRYEHV